MKFGQLTKYNGKSQKSTFKSHAENKADKIVPDLSF